MARKGHIKVNRYYEDYIKYPDDYHNLENEDIYYEPKTRQYKAKFYCAECNTEMWFCYPKSDMLWLIHELEEGILCSDCGNAINPYDEPADLIGRYCMCNK